MSIKNRFAKKITMLIGVAAITGISYAQSSAASVEMMGINIAGAEFTSGVLPGKNNINFIYAKENTFKEWSARGVKLVRFPILWERMQPRLNGDLDREHVQLLNQTLNYAKKYNMQIIIDIHNYGRYYKKVLGKEVPYSGYAIFLQKLTMEFNHQPAILGWDIMNEPTDMPKGTWFKAAQAGIDAIRSYDKKRPIFVEGDAWASASRWKTYSDELKNLKDPYDNIVYSAHMYLDKYESGLYYHTEDMSKVHANTGVDKVKPFVEWLKANNKKGYIGEMGIPDNDPRWNIVLDNTLKYLSDNCVPTTYWAAGPWWSNYSLSIEPKNGKDRPQWGIVKKYVGKKCDDFGPINKNNPIVSPESQITLPADKPSAPTENTGSVLTAKVNNFTSKEWNKGIWRDKAGFSIPNTPSNKASFVKGANVILADGQVRKISVVYIVGNNISVYLEGAKLDANKVGYPKTIAALNANATNPVVPPSVPATKPTAPVTPPTNSTTISSSLNNFNGGSLFKGIWTNDSGFSIPLTANNKTYFKTGNYVKFSDNQVRRIRAVYISGSNMSVYVDGSKLDGKKVGYPNKVIIENKTIPAPTAPTKPPVETVSEVRSVINNYTNNDWNKGIWRKSAGLSISSNDVNKKTFKVGTKIKFADNQVRTIQRIYMVGNSMSIYVDGANLNANTVGFPNKISNVK